MLFRAALRSLGYRITSLQGQRGLLICDRCAASCIHKLLQVELSEGSYLADLGLCNLAATWALSMKPLIEHETLHELTGFIDIGGEVRLRARFRHDWQHIYRVIPCPRYDGEYEITNWYTGTHPETSYQGNIIVARPGSNRSRITMYNARVTVRDTEGRADKRWLAKDSEYHDMLRGAFPDWIYFRP